MIYQEIEIEDMEFEKDSNIFTYPCPCGDRFEVSIDDLFDESTDIATCPNCGLEIQVLFEKVSPTAYYNRPITNTTNNQIQSYLLKFRKDDDGMSSSIPAEVHV